MTRQRFWSKVDQSAGPDACWPYRGGIRPDGYGVFYMGTGSLGAHQAAWLWSHGRPKTGLVVRHKCDVRSCCNPAHLELGTHQDNMNDKKSRNRCWRGGPKPRPLSN